MFPFPGPRRQLLATGKVGKGIEAYSHSDPLMNDPQQSDSESTYVLRTFSELQLQYLSRTGLLCMIPSFPKSLAAKGVRQPHS